MDHWLKKAGGGKGYILSVTGIQSDRGNRAHISVQNKVAKTFSLADPCFNKVINTTSPAGAKTRGVCVAAHIHRYPDTAIDRPAMIILNIDKLLDGRSYYWLAQKTGIFHMTIRRLASSESCGVQWKTLDKLCEALGCQPGDLIVRKRNETAYSQVTAIAQTTESTKTR